LIIVHVVLIAQYLMIDGDTLTYLDVIHKMPNGLESKQQDIIVDDKLKEATDQFVTGMVVSDTEKALKDFHMAIRTRQSRDKSVYTKDGLALWGATLQHLAVQPPGSTTIYVYVDGGRFDFEDVYYLFLENLLQRADFYPHSPVYKILGKTHTGWALMLLWRSEQWLWSSSPVGRTNLGRKCIGYQGV
jgi:hypothetical protein